MNTFLNDMFQSQELQALDEWSRRFWRVNPNQIKTQFAQQGYEEKGHGHIEYIISNVGELLEKYFQLLETQNQKMNLIGRKQPGFKISLRAGFEKILILFYVSAHLHDIGMGFPGIFKSMSGYLKEKGQNPQHIGAIIHEYHHYASFIVMLEMSLPEAINATSSQRPYLSNLALKNNKKLTKLYKELRLFLENIHTKHFEDFEDSIKDFKEFLILLGILSLLHKEIDMNYVRSILRKFQDVNMNSVDIFNKWWCYFERGRAWTEKLHQRFQRVESTDLPDISDHELLISRKGAILDLCLVEALLQYGDKTDITIARLTRKPIGYDKLPIEDFIEDISYDDKIGYINTNIAQRVISEWARYRACCFLPVILVNVETRDAQNGKKSGSHELFIVIHYLRFKGDESVFKYIRYNDEKDFFDLKFLEAIRFHLPVVVDWFKKKCEKIDDKLENSVFPITFKKEEHRIDTNERLKEAIDLEKPDPYFKRLKLPDSMTKSLETDVKIGVYNLARAYVKAKFDYRKIFPFTQLNKDAIKKNTKIKKKKKENESQKVFMESCDLTVPASFEVMAVLNLFSEGEE